MSEQGGDLEGRSIAGLFLDSFQLYGRYPLLFLVLAAVVIVPYRVIVLVCTGTDAFSQGRLSFGVGELLSLTDLVLVTPLVSALHVHVVAADRAGEVPRAGEMARRGLRALPVVAVASLVSWLGTCLGFLLFIVPGIVLMLRWAVVAQAAALEPGGWRAALRRSADLCDGHYWRIFGFLISVFLLAGLPVLLLGLPFGGSPTALSFLVGLVAQVLAWSFAALATAMLYFDLRTRLESRVAAAPPQAEASPQADAPLAAPATQADRSWDPRDHSDRDRPPGWYVDPEAPQRMRYWGAGGVQGWGGKARTPSKIQSAWEQAAGMTDG